MGSRNNTTTQTVTSEVNPRAQEFLAGAAGAFLPALMEGANYDQFNRAINKSDGILNKARSPYLRNSANRLHSLADRQFGSPSFDTDRLHSLADRNLTAAHRYKDSVEDIRPTGQRINRAVGRLDTTAGKTQNRLQNINPLRSGNHKQNRAYNLLNKTARGDFLDEGNPYLQDMIGNVSDDITRRSKSLFSGSGRYGSEAHQDTLSESLADAQNDLLYSNFATERQNQLAAQGQLGDIGTTIANQRLGVFDRHRAANNDMFAQDAAKTDRRTAALNDLFNQQLGVSDRMGSAFDRLQGARDRQMSVAREDNALAQQGFANRMAGTDRNLAAASALGSLGQFETASHLQLPQAMQNFSLAPGVAMGNLAGYYPHSTTATTTEPNESLLSQVFGGAIGLNTLFGGGGGLFGQQPPSGPSDGSRSPSGLSRPPPNLPSDAEISRRRRGGMLNSRRRRGGGR